MGYRSDVIIAVHRETYTKHFVMGTIPQALNDAQHWKTQDACYWHLDSWKFYPRYPDVAEILAWFDALDEELDVVVPFNRRDREGNIVPATRPQTAFGAMRLGEERGDVEEWGQPDEYDIFHSEYIDFPEAPSEESPCDTSSSSSPTAIPSSS